MKIIRLETNETLYEKKTVDSCPAVFMNHDTRFLVGGQDVTVIKSDNFEKETRFEGFEGKLFGAVVVPPDEREMILSDDGTGRIIDLESGTETGRFEEFLILDEKHPISPDGKTLLVCHGDEVAIFDIPSRRLIKKFPEYGGNCRAVVSPDFTMVVAGKEEKRVVYRIPDGKKLFNLTGKRSVESISFSPDGRLILMADWASFVRICDASNCKTIFEKALDEYDSSMPEAGFIGDGSRYFIRYNFKHLEVFDTVTHERLSSVRKKDIPARQSLIVSPDARFYIGHQLLKGVEVVDLKTGKSLRNDHLGEKCISSFAPDLPRNRLFYGTADGTIRVPELAHHVVSGKNTAFW